MPIDFLLVIWYNVCKEGEKMKKRRKGVGEGILPKINSKAASAFEDAFMVLFEFGEPTFRHYVSQQPAHVQQDIFDVFRLFKLCIENELLDEEVSDE